MTWLAIAFALASAAGAAVSTAVQHLAASRAPTSVGIVGLVLHLAQRRTWLVGQAIAVVGLVFHALALANGPLALVQPIIITGIVFAVPVRAAFSRQWPARYELFAVVLTASALAVFLLASDPAQSSVSPSGSAFALVVAASAGLGLVVLALSRRVGHPTSRAFFIGAGAGLFFGLVAVLLKSSSQILSDGGIEALVTAWQPYALIACGVSGVGINQLSYRTARLSASMPVLNVTNILLALSFGYLVFEEAPRHSPVAVALEVVSLGAVCVGLWMLARYEEQEMIAPELERAAPQRT